MKKLAKIDYSQLLGVVEANSVAYIETAFQALQDGVVVVPLRSNDDRQRIEAANVTEIISPKLGGGWLKPTLVMPDGDALAHVSFTSGTEGTPKGVFISRSALSDVVQRVQSIMNMDSSVREYIGVPVYHSFGYGRCRHVASVGGHFYIPSQGFDPRELSTMLKKGEVNALSLVPSLLRLLINTPDLLGDERLSLKWLEIGSQAMSQDEKISVRQLFPNAVIVQHYGLTEASRTTLLRIDNASKDVLDSVGWAYGDVELSVNGLGCICIKGSHVASQILKDGVLNPAVNTEGWFETTDLGSIKDGHLYFYGRADNVVNCGGQKLPTEKLEAAILNDGMFKHSAIAVSRIPHDIYGEGFLVSYTCSDDISSIKNSAETSLSTLGIKAKGAISFYCVDEIPKTHTGKVQHKQLSSLFLNRNASEDDKKRSDTPVKMLRDLFANVLGMDSSSLDVKQSVVDIGIDSLQSVRLSIHIEKFLGYLPLDWRDQSIEHLSALPVESSKPPTAEDASRVMKTGKAKPLWDGSSNGNPSGISFYQLIKEDFNTHERDFFSQGFFALFVNRFGNWRMGFRSKLVRFPLTILYRVLRKMAQVFCGIKLDYTVHVGRRVKLEHFGGMILGARSIGDDTIIRQNTTFGIRDISDLSAKPTIEAGVNIGAGAVVVGDITVGRHSVIGPNCVVSENIPPFSVVAVGAPVVTNMEGASDE